MKFIRKLVLIVLLVLLSSCSSQSSGAKFKTMDDLREAEVVEFANCTNNISYAEAIAADMPGIRFTVYNNYYDTFLEVANGNRDAALVFSSLFGSIKEVYPSLECIKSEQMVPIVATFSDGCEDLKADFDDFTANHEELIAELAAIHVDTPNDKHPTYDFDALENINGRIVYGVYLANVPMNYIEDGMPTGFEVALIYEYAKDRGYAVDLMDTDFTAVMVGIASGKYDISTGFYGFTEERNEGVVFSEPYFHDHIGYVVKGDDIESTGGFIDDLKVRIDRNFIREDRYKLILDGLAATLEIAFISIGLGSLIGFGLFMLSRNRKYLEKLALKIDETFESLPVLIVLLIFFYIIFGKSSISGFIVSVMVFALVYIFTFFKLIYGSVKGVDIGQNEGALALGYTPSQSLFKVVIPQALDSFLPAYKSSIIATLKSTSIVGYVAVRDLTKAGDLIRSMTFDAFLPIVTVALIYYVIARLLIYLLDKLFVIDRRRNSEKFLKECCDERA